MSSHSLPRDNLSLAVDSFLLAEESEGVSPRTLEAYRLAAGKLEGWLRDCGTTEPVQVTVTDTKVGTYSSVWHVFSPADTDRTRIDALERWHHGHYRGHFRG